MLRDIFPMLPQSFLLLILLTKVCC